MIGQKLAHYEILEKIGAGGMGEVYRARDTKLGRDVAIKVLPEDFAANEERLARFQREAQVLASLNHPNIAAIYGVEQTSLVLELVEGPTLAERLQQGPIPFDEALAIARQISEALEAAHEAGIVHRDLKPANVKVRDDGTVKVLDFGLAKAIEGERDRDASESPTMTAAATRAGVIMGTAAYMSPEQAKGKRVDKRADVWAFGAVLFEMLTGKRAFAGEDVSDTLAAVLRDEPAWNTLPSATPETLRAYLRRCLEKDPKRRVRDIGDVRLAMEGAFDVPAVAAPQATRTTLLAAVAAGLLIGALIVGLGSKSARQRVAAAAVPVLDRRTSYVDRASACCYFSGWSHDRLSGAGPALPPRSGPTGGTADSEHAGRVLPLLFSRWTVGGFCGGRCVDQEGIAVRRTVASSCRRGIEERELG